jgi:hypothetical protein
MTSRVGLQDPIVQFNVERAIEMGRQLKDHFDEDAIRQLAQGIFHEGIEIIRGEVRKQPIVTADLTPVMVALSDVNGSELIQSEWLVLISTIKAYRIMTELAWARPWNNKRKPVVKNGTRVAVMKIAKDLKDTLLKAQVVPTIGEVLISPAGVRYELSCLKQAAKYLEPVGGIWEQFITPVATAVGGAATLSLGPLVTGLMQIETIWGKERLADWYVDLFPLEWEATDITTVAQFDEIIAPAIEKFTSKGGKYTVGLVKILVIISDNLSTDEDLKRRVVTELVKLLTTHVVLSTKNGLNLIGDALAKGLKNPDRFAQARSFASWILVNIARKTKDGAMLSEIKAAFIAWKGRVEDKESKEYVQEKKEAENRVDAFKKNRDTLKSDRRILLDAFEDDYRGDADLDRVEEGVKEIIEEWNDLQIKLGEGQVEGLEKELKACRDKAGEKAQQMKKEEQDLDGLVKLSQKEIEVAKAYEAFENQESAFINQVFAMQDWLK